MNDTWTLATHLLPKILLLALGLNLLIGAAIFVFGRRLPRRGDWLACIGFVLAIAALGFSLRALSVGAEEFPRQLLWGWVGRHAQQDAITVGVLSDYVGLVLGILSFLVAGVLALNFSLLSPQPRAERVYAALSVGATGVALAWVSLTVWFSLAGLALVVLAAFMAMAARSDDDAEAKGSSRFLGERAVALFLATAGALALVSRGADLSFVSGGAWGFGIGSRIAAAILLAGLFLGMQSFPNIASATAASETWVSSRILLTQVFPGWATLALLTRLHPQLGSIGASMPLGWVALATVLLTVVSGLFQDGWVGSSVLWVSAGMSMAVAAQELAGPAAGVPIALGIGLGGVALSLSGAALDEGGSSSAANRVRALWAKAGALVAAATGAGFIGFYSGGGMIRWLSSGIEEPALAVAFAAALVIVGLLAWKSAWQAAKQKNFTQASWGAIISALALPLLGLGVFWTGTLTGGAIPGKPDLVIPPLSKLLFPSATGIEEPLLLTAGWVQWGCFVVAALVGYWTTARKQSAWKQLQKSAPGFSAFVTSGYGAEALGGSAHRAILWAGRELDRWVDLRAWQEWIPGGLSAAVRLIGSGVAEADERSSDKLGVALRRGIDVPAKLLQLIQSGEVQWYLFFGIGSGIAILIHFLKV